MPVKLNKSSKFSKKPSIHPDVSPKVRTEYNVRDRTIAIMVAAAFLAVVTLGIGAFMVHDNHSVEEAKADLEAQKAAHIAEYGQKVIELNEREQKLTIREEALAKAEADLESAQALLASDRAGLTAEEEAFYDKQSRVRELSEALYLELTPTE